MKKIKSGKGKRKMRNVTAILIILSAAALYGNENSSSYRSALYQSASNRSLTFAAAADLALASSAELKQTRAAQELREGAWKWGLRAYFPKIGISVSENDRLQKTGADSFFKNYNISMDQLVWDGGRTSMSRKLERMEIELVSSGLDRMAGEIAENAISAYRNVLSSRAILEIREASLTILEEQRRILSEETVLGLALPVDLAGADINLADAKLDIHSLKLDLIEMERQFAELLGLESLPALAEKVDIHRSSDLPAAAAAGSLAQERNPALAEARFSITKRQAELKFASHSWIPSLRMTGSFGLSGQEYPLTRHNWSAGINIEFSSPWFQNKIVTQTGWESLPADKSLYDKTAMVQNNFEPLPNPAASYGKHQAKLALALERENYNIAVERTGRTAVSAVEKCALAEQKRILALEAAKLGEERCRLEELRLELGQITRLKLMEILIEQTQKEIAVVQAATSLLEAERQLEFFLDLNPGELKTFSKAAITKSVSSDSTSK